MLDNAVFWAKLFMIGLVTYIIIMGYSYATFKFAGKTDPIFRIALLVPLLLLLGGVVWYAIQFAYVVKLF